MLEQRLNQQQNKTVLYNYNNKPKRTIKKRIS